MKTKHQIITHHCQTYGSFLNFENGALVEYFWRDNKLIQKPFGV
jgi:hypothetical protein